MAEHFFQDGSGVNALTMEGLANQPMTLAQVNYKQFKEPL